MGYHKRIPNASLILETNCIVMVKYQIFADPSLATVIFLFIFNRPLSESGGSKFFECRYFFLHSKGLMHNKEDCKATPVLLILMSIW